jgi:hypothetical protein
MGFVHPSLLAIAPESSVSSLLTSYFELSRLSPEGRNRTGEQKKAKWSSSNLVPSPS